MEQSPTMENTNQNAENNESGSGSSSDSSGNRWNPDVLDDMECKNVFVDDAEEHLPELFDHERIPKVKTEECQLCQETFNLLKRQRHYCKSCGLSVCDLCSQSSRRLSKMDKKEHRVCDKCDHTLSNH